MKNPNKSSSELLAPHSIHNMGGLNKKKNIKKKGARNGFTGIWIASLAPSSFVRPTGNATRESIPPGKDNSLVDVDWGTHEVCMYVQIMLLGTQSASVLALAV